jgi:hypothetical protein
LKLLTSRTSGGLSLSKRVIRNTIIDQQRAHEHVPIEASSQQRLHNMRGVIAVCVIYMLLPITLMYLFSLFSSGFPVFPLLTGLAIWWSNRKDQRR